MSSPTPTPDSTPPAAADGSRPERSATADSPASAANATPGAAPAPGRRPRRRSLAARLALALAATLLFLGLAEVGARVYHRVKHGEWLVAEREPPLYGDHPALPYAPIPGAMADRSTPLGHRVRVVIGPHGFRGEPPATPRPRGERRVVTLGGSTTFCVFQNEGDTWPARLQRLLAAPPSADVKVFNCGVPGYMSRHSLHNLAHRILEWEPDVVICCDLYNDLKPNRAPGFEPDYSHWERVVKKERQESENSLSAALADRSVLWLKLRFKLGLAPNNRAEPDPTVKRFDTVDERGVIAFQRNVESMAAICRARGIDFVIATCPLAFTRATPMERLARYKGLLIHNRKLTVRGVVDGAERYNAALRDAAVRTGAPLIDLEAAAAGREDLFGDECHFNDEGCDRIARAAAPVVAEILARRAESHR
ncbi:MAG: SGNH/GDSL hydrolase family protein [Planctomycetes bacterium]|nr:SGNH/GDSL hydrolase family protein [Planctomycetota bacterium]